METVYWIGSNTLLSQDLLPIREAYEWKLKEAFWRPFLTKNALLPIREAYEWKRVLSGLDGLYPKFLLPIR